MNSSVNLPAMQERDHRGDEAAVDQAIEWARARAEVVLIRTGDGDYHSAGTRAPESGRYPPWPPADLRLERRRVRGFEALDNAEGDPAVLWDVRIEAQLPDGFAPQPYYDYVKTHSEARDVQAPAPGYSEVSAAFLVRASTLQEARTIAEAIAHQAVDTLLDQSPRAAHDGAFYHGCEVYPHRPDKPVDGRGISY